MKSHQTNQNLGDVTFTVIVGSILAFLPERNGLRRYIDEDPSMYDINTAINKLSNVRDCCRVFKFKLCDEGKCIIPKDIEDGTFENCMHTKVKNVSFHYLPIRDRIWRLLHSDVKNLFHTANYMLSPEDADEVKMMSI